MKYFARVITQLVKINSKGKEEARSMVMDNEIKLKDYKHLFKIMNTMREEYKEHKKGNV